MDRLSIHQLWQSCVLRILLQLSPCFFQGLVSFFIGIARFQIFQLQEVGMGNLWKTGEVRNHRQVAITTIQLHFLDDVVITTMVEISGDETLQIALCLDAGVNTCTVPVTLGDVFDGWLDVTIQEMELNGGYCDLTMIPDLTRFPEVAHAYLMELKYLKTGDTDEAGNKALEEARAQLEQYAQDARLPQLMNGKPIHKIAIIYKGNDLWKVTEC